MTDYFKLDVTQALRELEVDPVQGLSESDVAKRQAHHGKNTLPTDEGTNWLKLFFGQFTDLMVIILLVAAVVSALLGDTKDVIVIMAIVVLNAILGIYQEYKAEQALAALNALQVPMVRVRRGGNIVQISAEDLVPGDIVLLDEGDRVPADGRLIESINLQIDESALTGESVPVDKSTVPLSGDKPVAVGDRSNMAFMGTAVNYGRGALVVTQTGLKTELGSIAAMLLQVQQGETPLQRRLNDLGKALAIGAGIIVTVVFIAGVIRGIPVQDMFLTSISLAVAAVPEGLPALITISLSLGAARMVRRHALIRRLPAVESLGSVTVICSDKTGTLTKNEMTATTIALPGIDATVRITGSGYTPEGKFHLSNETFDTLEMRAVDPEKLKVSVELTESVKRFVRALALSTNAHVQPNGQNGRVSVMGDTTEAALLVAARKAGLTREELEIDLPRVGELPFSSDRKAMTTIHKIYGGEARKVFPQTDYISITKGAPDQLVEWATHELVTSGPVPLTPERRQSWYQQIDDMAKQGLRVLGVAYRPLPGLPEEITPSIERDLYLMGLVGILDPARPEARDAVKTARDAGIRTLMITGDHALTAEAIARDLGILQPGQKAITGAELDQMSDQQVLDTLKQTSAFARVSPQHKLRLVQVLQSQNEIVAMTGDGVNDAPALKQANIGVAMGITGTDVSKGAAEMVLTDDNFASIVAAIEEGRVIYDNIRKFIRYLLSSNVGEILVMFLSLLAGLKIPLLAIQILWINLVTDGLPAIALGFEPAEAGVMKRKPRPITENIFAGGMGRHIIIFSLVLTAVTLTGYLYGYAAHQMNPLSPTLALEYLSSAQLDTIVIDKSVIPANWDSLSTEERRATLSSHENDDPTTEKASGGLIGEAERLPRTIGFSVLALGQIFHVIAIHGGDKESFFNIGFKGNIFLALACLSTFLLQLAVIYVPFLEHTFETAALSLGVLAMTIGLAALMFVGVEIEKFFRRRGALAA
jgi:Ca2+-transporting ATPase